MCATALLIYKHDESSAESSTQIAETYFLNQNTNNLECEKRILQATEVQAKIDEILNILLVQGPTNKSLKMPSTTPVTLLGTSVVGDTAFVYFDLDYNSLSDVDKIYLKSSITWSLTSLEEINSVIFYVGEEILGTGSNTDLKQESSYKYDRSYVFLNPTIDPQNSILINLRVYFVNKSNNLLNEEQRLNIYANPNVIKEYYIVDELIKGSTNSELYSAIPKSTKIINVETDNRVCYVNLSSDFVTKQPDDILINTLSVYQIVNSLTLLDNVDAVQIFIDSKKVKGFKHSLDLSETLTSDESLIEVQKGE